MTLCIAWIRKLKNQEELLIVTDSRLRAFGAWDCGPKIMTLPRTDCAICFDGDATYAYPMMVHLQTAVANYPKANNRSQDIYDFKTHILKILNDLMTYKDKTDYEVPYTSFLLGGYSWKKERFVLWKLHYVETEKKFRQRPISFWKGVKGTIKVSFSGDYTNDAKNRLVKILKERDILVNGSLDMEPFEIMRDMLLENDETKYHLIGGAPQLVKVYKHMNRTPIAVNWSVGSKKIISLLGRPLLNYEKTRFPILDIKSLEIERGDILGM